MSHPETEALLRLTGGSADDDVRRHVESCAQCQADLSIMRRARAAGATLAAEPALTTLSRPPSGVWEGIQRQLEDEEAAAEVSTPAPAPAAAAATQTPRSTRRTWLVVAASVAAGAILGGSVMALAGRDDTTPQAAVRTTSLQPLAGHTTSGTLAMTGTPSREALTVKLDDEDRGDGFLEVWLLDARTGGMVSLGVLDGDRGSYAVPAGLDLSGYNQVDVSREPFDGNPAHSKVSLARGPVP